MKTMLVTAALVAATAVPAHAASTIKVDAQLRSHKTTSDGGFIVRERLLDPATGAKLGRDHIVCDGDHHCHGRLVLADGVLRLRYNGNTARVVDGTGAYAGAKGTVRTRDGKAGIIHVTVKLR